jgi:hypothetical protein
MMMQHTDPRTVDHLISARQDAIAETFRASQHPSRLRVAAGIALIRLGERLRGCSMAAPARMPAMPVTGLRPARSAS